MSDITSVKKYLKAWLTTAVKGGFDKEPALLRDLRERIQDEMGEPHEPLRKELAGHVAKLLEKQRASEVKWTKRTTNDAVDDAFAALDRAGIVALQNAGYTMSDGWEDVNELATNKKQRPRGATFYHGQDLERGVAGEGLLLAYGAYEDDKKKHDAASVAVGREVVEMLARFGVKTSWNGHVDARIHILPFRWQRRRFTRAPKA